LDEVDGVDAVDGVDGGAGRDLARQGHAGTGDPGRASMEMITAGIRSN